MLCRDATAFPGAPWRYLPLVVQLWLLHLYLMSHPWQARTQLIFHSHKGILLMISNVLGGWLPLSLVSNPTMLLVLCGVYHLVDKADIDNIYNNLATGEGYALLSAMVATWM